VLNFIDNLSIKLTKGVRSSDATLTVSPIDAVKLNAMPVGSHIYLTLEQGSLSEVVKYTHLANHTASSGAVVLAVQRDVNGTGAKNFAVPICARAVWSKLQLKEFICQTIGSC
jgi:hypothetical protein